MTILAVLGEMLEGWPRQLEDLQLLSAPAIADISGDGKADVVAISAGLLAHAWESNGEKIDGWPKHTGGWILGSPAVGDITGDGYLDVVVTTREGKLLAWTTKGEADQKIEWASIHHDAQNTGNYGHPLPVQEGPPVVEGPPESGCCSEKGNSEAALLMLPLLMWGGLRRRREH